MRHGYCVLALGLALAVLVVAPGSAQGAEAKKIGWQEAADHVGEEVVVEGRIGATHATPTAVLLSFHPQFAGLSVVIFAPDFPNFTAEPARAFRGRRVRVTGEIEKRYGRLQIVARESKQIKATDKPPARTPPAPTPAAAAPPAPQAATAADVAEMGAALELLSRRLTMIEARLAALEEWTRAVSQAPQAPAVAGGGTSRIFTIHSGYTTDDVMAAFGPPDGIAESASGSVVWYYGRARSITFDRRGRVESWVGF